MKKGFYTLVGIVLGLLLALPFQALSDSLVGKQVDMIAPVKLDGEYLEVDAIGIKGTTYAPVRALSEALGKDVDWIDGEVIIETPVLPETGDVEMGEGKNDNEVMGDTKNNEKDHATILEKEIEANRNLIEIYRYTMQVNEQNGASPEANQNLEETIQRLEQQILEYEQILEELKAQQKPEEALQE